MYARNGVDLRDAAMMLREAGVKLVQYRDKTGSPQRILEQARAIREAFADSGATLILNDRADLCVLAEWDGVHVGQGDLAPEDARRVLGAGKIVGISTHSEAQVLAADASCADYVAVGPVFATGSKPNAEPMIGLDGVRRARALTAKPIVAIGGITSLGAAQVMEAGADSVAVIGALLSGDSGLRVAAMEWMSLLA
jgi:thiamine-phosphate pyrophosphorylase